MTLFAKECDKWVRFRLVRSSLSWWTLPAPEKTFGALMAFLRLTPTAVQLGQAIEASCFIALTSQEERDGFRERPVTSRRFFRQGRAGAWTERLTPAQVRAILEAQAPMMRRLGYLGTAGLKPYAADRNERSMDRVAIGIRVS